MLPTHMPNLNANKFVMNLCFETITKSLQPLLRRVEVEVKTSFFEDTNVYDGHGQQRDCEEEISCQWMSENAPFCMLSLQNNTV